MDMNIIEAVKLAKKGNKIRCKRWYYQNYIYERNGSLYKFIGGAERPVLYKEPKAKFSDLDVLDDTWEILEGTA